MHIGVWNAMATELSVTETWTRRFIERWAPFSISVNTAVPLQFLAVMELGRSDREPESLVTHCGRPCSVLCPCLENVDNRPPYKANIHSFMVQKRFLEHRRLGRL